jgi:hypothetical protein
MSEVRQPNSCERDGVAYVIPGGSRIGEITQLRPFYFIVVFWGDRFHRYLTDFCLPSLLSANNIPVLEGTQNKFIFCTTSEDWEVLRATKIFLRLQDYIEPYFIEIPTAPSGRSGCEHMGVGHKLAAQKAYQDKAFGVFLTPDLMISDGTVSAIYKHAAAGVKVVLMAALRFGEEPLFENFRLLGLTREGERPSETGEPLTITARQMVAVGLRSFHSESQRYEWQASYFTDFPSACWWRVPGEDGIVLHSLSWAPILCDYAAVVDHDTSIFDTWTLDGDYIYRNFGDSGGMHIVTDSDEMMLLSWAPLDDRPQNLETSVMKRLPIIGSFLKGGILRAAVLSGVFDRLKHRIFFKSVRWHAGEFTNAWEITERKAATTLRRYLADVELVSTTPTGTSEGLTVPWIMHKMLLNGSAALGRVWIVISQLYQYRGRVRMRLSSALHGDRDAWARILRRIRIVWRLVRGTPIENP